MHIKRVFINYLFTTMQKDFITGLKLRNSLSNQLVNLLTKNSKHSFPWTARMSSGTHVDQPSTPTAIWDTQGIDFNDKHRNYMCNDMIRRVLRDHFGYNIQYCMNITDVDDKIINRSNEEGIEYFEFARKW